MTEKEAFVSESKVSGNQANIPAEIRRSLEIDDGDALRWRYEDGELTVDVVHKTTRTFDDWEPERYVDDGDETDVVEEHDAFGVN
ncbi:AbrB/MazE/SpoVT family DNA-binding domain-containing protein [Haladaptatus sp. F3-133]|jgi:bifunctional DNA-binding transcriptional regulator/antitoxin component of YhaV-PrlF toxin-antitoxin module|uniref:AbrB/MazE/SpoVT family DNA-binding domain-containing protein n=1 Tax=Halorutilus salinus TaxID=2487751 RepID=A0A9Q4C691_9EURY|nr:AbrB/MazE/SpoVT family DNA-binding domain-containing protein [Halorutilus salinus]MCX2819857.1 AbrB/MazE/SpoVT family DNA-binding domain-containing protein [Halorutilus salinus]